MVFGHFCCSFLIVHGFWDLLDMFKRLLFWGYHMGLKKFYDFYVLRMLMAWDADREMKRNRHVDCQSWCINCIKKKKNSVQTVDSVDKHIQTQNILQISLAHETVFFNQKNDYRLDCLVLVDPVKFEVQITPKFCFDASSLKVWLHTCIFSFFWQFGSVWIQGIFKAIVGVFWPRPQSSSAMMSMKNFLVCQCQALKHDRCRQIEKDCEISWMWDLWGFPWFSMFFIAFSCFLMFSLPFSWDSRSVLASVPLTNEAIHARIGRSSKIRTWSCFMNASTEGWNFLLHPRLSETQICFLMCLCFCFENTCWPQDISRIWGTWVCLPLTVETHFGQKSERSWTPLKGFFRLTFWRGFWSRNWRRRVQNCTHHPISINIIHWSSLATASTKSQINHLFNLCRWMSKTCLWNGCQKIEITIDMSTIVEMGSRWFKMIQDDSRESTAFVQHQRYSCCKTPAKAGITDKRKVPSQWKQTKKGWYGVETLVICGYWLLFILIIIDTNCWLQWLQTVIYDSWLFMIYGYYISIFFESRRCLFIPFTPFCCCQGTRSIAKPVAVVSCLLFFSQVVWPHKYSFHWPPRRQVS